MYTPFDIPRSDSLLEGVLDSAHAYSARSAPYVRLDINLEFHFNWSSSTLTVYASVLNALDIKNITYRRLYVQPDALGKLTAMPAYEYDLHRLPIAGIRFEF